MNPTTRLSKKSEASESEKVQLMKILFLLFTALTSSLGGQIERSNPLTSNGSSQTQSLAPDLTHKLTVQHQILSPQERLQYLRPSAHSGLIPEGGFGSSQTESPDQQAHRRLREEA